MMNVDAALKRSEEIGSEKPPTYVNAHSIQGEGSVCAVICEERSYFQLASQVEEKLRESYSVLPIRIRPRAAEHWEQTVDELLNALQESGKRQFRFVVFGTACSYIFALALRRKKMFRSLVLIDGEVSTERGFLGKMIDRLEHHLPLGLPFRLRTRGFSAMPFLQRMRFPVLVVVSERASEAREREAELLNVMLPIAWKLTLPETASMLSKEMQRFEEVPLKRPQKRLQKQRANS